MIGRIKDFFPKGKIRKTEMIQDVENCIPKREEKKPVENGRMESGTSSLPLVRLCREDYAMVSDIIRLSTEKASLSLRAKILVCFCSSVVCLSLMFMYKISRDTVDKVVVVDSAAVRLESHVSQSSDLLEALIKQHCAQTVYLANSFDRLSMDDNRRRASFLADASELATVFAMYRTNRAYSDVMDRGVIYRAELRSIDKLEENASEYSVDFSSVLTIIEGERTKRVMIRSHGICIRTTPRYPQNVTGFFFRKYQQEYETLLDE